MSLHLAFVLALLGCVAAAPGPPAVRTEDVHVVTNEVYGPVTHAGALACSLRPLDQSFTLGRKDDSLSLLLVLNSTTNYVPGLEVKYTEAGFKSEYYEFYYVEIQDMRKNGKNGIVTKSDGGLGTNHIKLRTEMCPGEGSEYTFSVWGKRIN